ncbi:MAG: hypothetical protein ABW092_16645 [Candidatus Thiodiazotropha sp.]
MTTFTPCQGKHACRDNGVICLTCQRNLTEITKLRELMQGLSTLAIDHEYENLDDYAQYIARKIIKMVDYQRQEQVKSDG